MTAANIPARVFISYCHKNVKQFQRLQTYLALYALNKEIFVWSDRDIDTGQDWDSEIRSALQTSDVAVLLVSVEFLTSKYIREVELPLLIEAADKQRLRLVSVVLNACDYGESALGRFQAVHDVSRPMSKLSTAQRDDIWLSVAKTVRETLQRPAAVHGNEIHLGELRDAEFEQLMHTYLSSVYGQEASVQMDGFEAGYSGDITMLNPDPIWGGNVIVELKRYSPDKAVPSSVVNQVAQYVATTGSSHGVIITTGTFQDEAIDLAQSSRVRLVDGALLVDLLQQQGFNAKLT